MGRWREEGKAERVSDSHLLAVCTRFTLEEKRETFSF